MQGSILASDCAPEAANGQLWLQYVGLRQIRIDLDTTERLYDASNERLEKSTSRLSSIACPPAGSSAQSAPKQLASKSASTVLYE